MGSVFDLWEQQLSRLFISYEYVTVDETVVPLPSDAVSSNICSVKLCLCDASTAYCLRHTLVLTTVQSRDTVTAVIIFVCPMQCYALDTV